jgi:hypothetical protein
MIAESVRTKTGRCYPRPSFSCVSPPKSATICSPILMPLPQPQTRSERLRSARSARSARRRSLRCLAFRAARRASAILQESFGKCHRSDRSRQPRPNRAAQNVVERRLCAVDDVLAVCRVGEGLVGPKISVPVGGSGSVDVDFAVGFGDVPVAVVDEPVVEPAEVDSVFHIGGSAVGAVVDVVGVGGGSLAAGPGAAG